MAIEVVAHDIALVGDEALRLRQATGEVGGHDQPHERDDVHQAPPARAEIGEPERHHTDAGTEAARHGQDAHGVGPRVAWHLLRRGDGDQEIECQPQGPPDGLARRQHGEGRGERAERGAQRCGERGELDHPSPPDPVGEQDDRQREQDPGPHDGAGDALAAVADAEVLGGEVDRLGEQRVDEGRTQRGRRQQAQDHDLAVLEPVRRRPPRLQAGWVARRRAVAQAASHERGERPPEPRQTDPVLRHLVDRSTAHGDEPALVVSERTVVLPYTP